MKVFHADMLDFNLAHSFSPLTAIFSISHLSLSTFSPPHMLLSVSFSLPLPSKRHPAARRRMRTRSAHIWAVCYLHFKHPLSIFSLNSSLPPLDLDPFPSVPLGSPLLLLPTPPLLLPILERLMTMMLCSWAVY